MARDLLRRGRGRFWRGNLHCHSDRSDGSRSPEQVAAAYREAGYDFIALSDHFEQRYGWQVSDTRDLRRNGFTTILAAELSSGSWEKSTTYWVSAVGLPPDFEAPPNNDPAEAIYRAHQAGAFLVLLHPALNNLPLAATERLPAFDVIDAVEIYNHNTFQSAGDHADGAYMVDGLLERGRRILVNAGDDAHFAFPADRFGGWVEVWSEALEPDALVASLKSGCFYSTRGPRLESLELDGDQLHVSTSSVRAIALGGAGEHWLHASSVFDETGGLIREGTFDLAAFRGSYCRVTVVDGDGRRAWSNPIWP